MPASTKSKPESGYSSRASSESTSFNGNSTLMTKIKQTNLFDFFFNSDSKSKIDPSSDGMDSHKVIGRLSNSSENDENTNKNNQEVKKPVTVSMKLNNNNVTGKDNETTENNNNSRLIAMKSEPIVMITRIDELKPEIKRKSTLVVDEINKILLDDDYEEEEDVTDSVGTEETDKKDEEFKFRRSRRQSICVEKLNYEKVEPKKISYKKYAEENAILPHENSKEDVENAKEIKEKSKEIKKSENEINKTGDEIEINKVEREINEKQSKNLMKNATTDENSEETKLKRGQPKTGNVRTKKSSEDSLDKIYDSDDLSTHKVVNSSKNGSKLKINFSSNKIKRKSKPIDPFEAMMIRLKSKFEEPENPQDVISQNENEDLKNEDPQNETSSKRPRDDSPEDAQQSSKRQKVDETASEDVQPEPEVDPAIIEEVIEDIWHVSVVAFESDPVARFVVKWDGFPPSENTLEPFEHVSHAEVLGEYVRRKFEIHQEKIDAAIEELSSQAKCLSEKYNEMSKKLIVKRLKHFDVLHFRCNILAYIYTYETIPHFCFFMRHLRNQCVLYKHFLKHEKEQESNKLFVTKMMKKEKNLFKITVENKLTFDPMPQFEYLRNVDLPKIERSRIGCNCEGSCVGSTSCCPNFLGLKPVYDVDSRLCASSHQMIVECNALCSCDNSCPNRPKRTKFNLCVFKTQDRGWALKSLDYIPAATFVIEYTGELIKMAEAKKRTREYKKLGVTYLFDLDYNEQNEATYSLDATHKGNLSRFINHSCNANLQTWPATSCNDNPETHRLYYFSLRAIKAGEELTVDYSGGVIRPKMNPPKDAIPCKCNSDNCRGFIF